MIKGFLHNRIRKFERGLDYDGAYMHEILDTSLDAFRKFVAFTNMARYAGNVPAEVRFAAQLAATISEDCGPCTQIVVNFALKSGVPRETLAALLALDFAAAGEAATFGYRFGDALARALPEIEELGPEAERRYGKKGRLALSFAAASARVYPAVKRGLGHAKECTRVKVGADTVWVGRRLAGTQSAG